MVDETGFLEDAIERAAELAGLDRDAYRTVEYESPFSLDGLLGFARAQQRGEWASLLDLTTPRVLHGDDASCASAPQPQYGGEP